VLSVFYTKKVDPKTAEAAAVQQFDVNKELPCKEAIQRVKEISKERKFKESVEAIIRLNVDPRQGQQNIRGTCVLPAGLGKQVKVCVFADADMQDKVMEAGADVFGTDDLLKRLAEGKADFDKLIATQEQMPALKPLARILGPKGLMPNVKSGTLVKADELLEAVRLSKQGQIEFRINEYADIMVKIGLREFDNDKLFTNFDAFAKALVSKKPEVVKGKYFIRGYLKTSMGRPVKLDLSHYQKLSQE
jgi:large subunit ribosomal protein L1